MKSIRNSVLMLLFTILIVTSGNAQITTTIKGVAFADYYYNFQNHSASAEKQNAFNFRRLYFTFENTINQDIKIRFRLEAKHDKYGNSSTLNPFVKHAYLEWANIIPMHKIYLGIAETNAFKNAESYWGYRSIEKTIMDLNKIASSADMGIAVKGSLVDEKVHHWLTIHNGPGYGSSEIDRYKKIGYAFWVTPVEGLILEGYADYEKQNPNDAQTAGILSSAKDYTGSTGYMTMKGFVGYSHPQFTVGAEAFWRTNKESGIKNVTVESDEITSSAKSDVKRFGYSLFGSWITPLPKLKAFARYDYFDPNTENQVYTDFSDGNLTGGIDDENTLIIAGFDYIPTGNIHIMPNILVKSYAQDGKDSDITARVTLYYKYDSGKIIVQ